MIKNSASKAKGRGYLLEGELRCLTTNCPSLDRLKELLEEIRNCTICADGLPFGPRPIIQASSRCTLAIIGQAPGSVVHRTGVPWDDKSGERLREWTGLSVEEFYDETKVALIPMGFCYPGKGRSGDLPPRKECAPEWHADVLSNIPSLRTVFLIGSYAQAYYLTDNRKKTLTETVKCFKEYLPEYFVLPHPSPRNNIWLKKNQWFINELLPELTSMTADLMGRR